MKLVEIHVVEDQKELEIKKIIEFKIWKPHSAVCLIQKQD